MRSVFWWLNLVRLYSLNKILYPKRRIESYTIRGTMVSPNKMLLICMETTKTLISVAIEFSSSG